MPADRDQTDASIREVWRATPLTVAVAVLTEAEAAGLDPLFAYLSSEWSEPMRLRAELRGDGTYLVEIKDAGKDAGEKRGG